MTKALSLKLMSSGRTPADDKAIYVTTDGGLLRPHKGGVQEAKLLRLEVGEQGVLLA